MNPKAEKMKKEILDIVKKYEKCNFLPCEVSAVLIRVRDDYYADKIKNNT